MFDRLPIRLALMLIVVMLGASISLRAEPDEAAGSSFDAPNDVAARAVVLDALRPLPPDQERHLVVDVQTFGEHDNAFDTWTYNIWQHWPAADERQVGIVVSDPAGEVVTQIVLKSHRLDWTRTASGQSTLEVFDVPLEFFALMRVLDFTRMAMEQPDQHDLHVTRDDGQIVMDLKWIDHYAEEFGYLSRAEVILDQDTKRLAHIIWSIDRPGVDPYPVRALTFQTTEVLPAGTSEDGTYQIRHFGTS